MHVSGSIECDSRLNVTGDGKRFRCDFIREGPVYYPENGKGIEVLRRATILANLNTFVGKPLTIEHIDPRLNVSDPEVFAKVAHGKIDGVGFDKETGWFFCEGDVTTEDARRAAMEYNPSCGVRVNQTGPGGRWNNLPFERELTQIEFHHLALSKKRARYEEADFRLNTVIDNSGKTMAFKFIRTIKAALGGAPKTEEIEVPADATVTLANGKEVRLNTVLESHTQAEEAEAKRVEDEKKAREVRDSRENAITDDTEVLVRGKKVKVKDLTAAYEARENAVTEAARKAEVEARENAALGNEDFRKLENARHAPAIKTSFPTTAGTLEEGLKRGKY